MAVKSEYLAYIEDQLSEFSGFETKKMFGGIGFFREGKMFGMIGGDVFRLKVDEHNQQDFEAKGMKPYENKTKKKGMPYWEVPVEVVEDKDALRRWAEKAYEAAIRGSK